MRKIEAENVRVGDTIRVTGQFTVTEVRETPHGIAFSHVDDSNQVWDFTPSTSTREITLITRDIRIPDDAQVAKWATEHSEPRTAFHDGDESWITASGITMLYSKSEFEHFLRTNAQDVQFYSEIK